MQLINKNNNIILADNVLIAGTIWTRLRGLLGKKEFKPGSTLIIKPCNSVHTFFMQFPIDVLFVDHQDKIIKIIPQMPPWRITSIYFNAAYAIEFPANTIQRTSVKVGDQINFTNKVEP